jgi:hypothetical protein
MVLLRNFKALPLPLKGLFLVFLTVPIFSLLVIRWPWLGEHDIHPSRTLLIIATYWLVPIAICLALLIKHNWFFVLYLAQCFFLTLHTIVSSHTQPTEMQLARFLLIGLMIYVGFLFGNRNFLYPLITAKVRFWRKDTRYRIGREIYVFAKTRANLVPGRLVECSLGGAKIAIHDEDLTTLLRNCTNNDSLHILIPPNTEQQREFVIPMEIRWHVDDSSGSRQFGCQTTNRKLMSAYMATENLSNLAPLQYPDKRGAKLEQEIQETALILWFVCIALSFAIPALS